MSEPAELEARVSALEHRVDEVAKDVRAAREDATAARHLAAATDRDISELHGDLRDFRRATTASFTAMRADLADQRRELTALRGEVADHGRQLTELRTDVTDLRSEMSDGFLHIRARLDATTAGIEQIGVLLNTLIDREAG